MKQKKHNLLLRGTFFAGILTLSLQSLHAVDGTWTGTTSGSNWSDTAQWSAATVADGSGSTAFFNTLDLPAGAFNVALDTARTIGSMTFGDTDTSTAGTWGVTGANTLTLAGATPTITTNVNVSIGGTAILSGSSGFTKAGTETLTINSASTLTGNINLNAGTIAIGKNGATNGGSVGSGTINMANGTTIRLTPTSSALAFVGNAISIASGASVTLNSVSSGNGFSSAITGDSTAILNLTNSSGAAVSFSATGTQQLANFNGNVEIASGNQLRFSSTSGPQGNGGANATFNVNGSVVARNGTTGGSSIILGALTGSGTLYGPSNSANTVTYQVGAKGTSTTFSGVITNGGFTGAIAALTKTGAGTLTLSGADTHTGANTVSAGVLNITGSKTGAGTTSVASSATLAGTGNWSGTTTVANGGIVSPGDATVTAPSIGNLTLGSLTLNTGSVLNVEFGSSTNDQVTVSSGGTLTLGSGVNVNVNGISTDGTYTIANISGATVSGTPSTALTATNGAAGKIYTFSSTSSAIVLTVSSSDPNNYWVIDGDDTWGTAANWTKGTVPNAAEAIARVGPGPSGAGGDFTNASLLITLDANRTVGTLVLNGIGSAVKTAITLDPGTGGNLIFNNAASASVLTSSNGDHTILTDVDLSANGLVVDVSDSAITPTPAISTLTMSGIISGTGANLVKSGASTLVLSGVNTYSGGTLLTNGVLAINTDAALGDASSALTFAGGKLRLDSAIAGDTRSFQVSGANNAYINTNTYSFGYDGVISPLSGATGGLTKEGTGTMTLSKPQTYTGTTTVGLSTSANGGILEVPTGASISGTNSTINYGKILVDGGSLTHTTTSGISQAGMFELSSGSASFAGINSNTSNANGNALILLSGGTFNSTFVSMGRGAANYANATVAPTNGLTTQGLYVNGGTATISGNLDVGQNNSATNSTANARIDSGSLTVGGVVGVSVSSPDRWSILDVNGGTFTSTDATTGVRIGGSLAGSVAFLVRNGVATAERILLQQSATQYALPTTPRTSLLNLTGGSLYVGAGGIVGNNNASTGIIDVRLGGGILGAKADWVSSVNATVTGTATLQGEDAAAAAHTITLSGVVSGTGEIVKTGAGTVTLSGANTYTGNTTVNAGTLSISNAYLADTSTVTIASGAAMNLNYTGTDTVDALIINGTPAAAGTWGATGSGATNIDDTHFTGTGTITVPGSGFASWITGTFANGTVASGDQGPLADPDGDGLSNALEYAFDNNDPTVGNGSIGTISGNTVSFTKRALAVSNGDVTYAIEESTDLGQSDAWADVTPTVDNSTTISFDYTVGVRDFFRARATIAP